MAHYAQIENGIVQQVISAEQNFIDTLPNPSDWIQTSYNTRGGIHYGSDGQPDGGIALRANYAGIDYTYDVINDVFYAPRPLDMNGVLCESWTISAPTWLWQPPIPYPSNPDNLFPFIYVWNETTQTWVNQS